MPTESRDIPFVFVTEVPGGSGGLSNLVPNSGGSSSTSYYKMRALADPGPGYVTWVSTDAPDFAGAGAGSPIQAGTAVAVAYWVVSG